MEIFLCLGNGEKLSARDILRASYYWIRETGVNVHVDSVGKKKKKKLGRLFENGVEDLVQIFFFLTRYQKFIRIIATKIYSIFNFQKNDSIEYISWIWDLHRWTIVRKTCSYVLSTDNGRYYTNPGGSLRITIDPYFGQ